MGTRPRKRFIFEAFSAALAVCALGLLSAPLEGQITSDGADKPSIGQSISRGFKQGAEKVSGAFKNKTSSAPTGDPTALSSRAKPSPKLFVALAQMHEEEGHLSEAAAQYEHALKLEPDYPGALLGLARLQERLGHPLEAVKFYERAAKANPEDASVANNRGLFYAKRKQYIQSITSLEEAVKLKPSNTKYRHNLALVLVQLGRNDEALRHLRVVHAEAVAHYNLGYLLKTKGDERLASYHFERAAAADPSLTAARYWLAELKKTSTTPTQQAQRPPVIPMAPMQTPAVRVDMPTLPKQRAPVLQPAAPPAYVADRPAAARPQVRVMPPPPRQSAPFPSLTGPQQEGAGSGPSDLLQPKSLGPAPMPAGLQPPMPSVARPPQRPETPPLPSDLLYPPGVRRLPTVD